MTFINFVKAEYLISYFLFFKLLFLTLKVLCYVKRLTKSSMKKNWGFYFENFSLKKSGVIFTENVKDLRDLFSSIRKQKKRNENTLSIWIHKDFIPCMEILFDTTFLLIYFFINSNCFDELGFKGFRFSE